MLSNKIRIFVVFGVLGLLFTGATAHAQDVADNWDKLKVDKAHFVLVPSTRENGILTGINLGADDPRNIAGPVNGRTIADFPDLWDLFRQGGSFIISQRIPEGTELTTGDYTKQSLKVNPSAEDLMKAKHKVVITEIMWAKDDPARTTAQWIEIYNNGLKEHDWIFYAWDWNKDTTYPAAGETYMVGENDDANISNRKFVVLDRVSTLNSFNQRWELKGENGASENDDLGIPAMDLVSMYRKIEVDDTGKAYKVENGKLKGLGDGEEASSWETTKNKVNMVGGYIGTPGHVEVGPSGPNVVRFETTPASFSDKGIIINEVRNDTSDENLDWIELFYNSDNASDPAVNVKNYTLSLAMGKMKTDGSGYHESGDANFTDTKLAVLPEYQMMPGDYLVIYNRDPGKSIALAGGVNVADLAAQTHTKKGATHKYAVAKDLNLPAKGKFLILLRTRDHADDVGKATNLKDYAGNGFFKRTEDKKFNTDVWPFIAWAKPGDVDDNDFGGMNTFASTNMSFGRGAQLNTKGMYVAKSRANRLHKDDWQSFKFMGTGYDRGKDRTLDTMVSPGTPGYPNTAIGTITDDRDTASTDDDYAFDGTVTISEIMYDAGPRQNLIQWIELYNSSMMETVNLEGWEFEIRNENTQTQSYVNAKFTFEAGTYILPNQTLLLVSSSGSNDVAENHVYNLQAKHRSKLGLTTREQRLLSPTGFHLELRAKSNKGGRTEMTVMDTAGNFKIDGTMRIHEWDLPASGDTRKSIVRIYGDLFNTANKRTMGAGPHDAKDGLMEDAWTQPKQVSGLGTYYGHRDDISTPGYRLGGPLPVSLSSFRPVRNTATGHVEITWITQAELNNAGFNILRSDSKNGEFQVINTKGLIAGHGTTSEKHVYTYTDTTAKPNVVYYYQIQDVAMDGVRTTLRTTHLRGDVSANGKLTTRWGELKSSDK